MSDNEATEQKIKKETKPRTQKQKEAFDKMIAKRKEIDEVKNAHKEALRKEKEMIREDRVKKIKEVFEKSQEQEQQEEEVVKPVKLKPVKAKPKKQIIIQESSSESEEEPEIVYIKKSKSSKKKKAKNKIIVKETSSESSEEEEPKHTATKLVNKKSEDQLRQDLHNEKLKSALRSLGYIE